MILNVQRFLVLSIFLFSSQAFAAGDPERGAIRGETCLGCHGVTSYTNVYPTFKVPKLGGQHGEYIAAALRAYRAGERAHGTMEAQAHGLTDQEIDDVSAYLAGLKQ
ncbi:MAG: cytochrome c [Pseudomonadota bacterium]